jgi:hypothetical protein
MLQNVALVNYQPALKGWQIRNTANRMVANVLVRETHTAATKRLVDSNEPFERITQNKPKINTDHRTSIATAPPSVK